MRRFQHYKVRQSWITNIFKNVLQSAMGLQSATDYKAIQYSTYIVSNEASEINPN